MQVLENSCVANYSIFYREDCRDVPILMDTGIIVILLANKVQENLTSFSHFLCMSPSLI